MVDKEEINPAECDEEMKCKKCGTFLTANTLLNCPNCGSDQEAQEKRNIRLWEFIDDFALVILIGFIVVGIYMITVLWEKLFG